MRGDEPCVGPSNSPLKIGEFPACAGMNRQDNATATIPPIAGVPRMRGDEPVEDVNEVTVTLLSSPHARG